MEIKHVFWAILALLGTGIVLSLIAVALRPNHAGEDGGDVRESKPSKSFSLPSINGEMFVAILGIVAYFVLMFFVLPNVFPKFWLRWYGNPEFFWGTNVAFIIGIIIEVGYGKEIGRWISVITWIFVLSKCVGWACWLC
jgi:hypothetical protein